MQADSVYKVVYPSTKDSYGWKQRVRGIDFVEFLRREGLLPKAANLENALVSGWMADPSSYPAELHGKTVLLLNSKPVEGEGYVATLEWQEGRIICRIFWLQHLLDDAMPALILEE